MAVTVSFFGYLRAVTGRQEMRLPWQGGTLEEFILHLSSTYGEAIAEELFDELGQIDRAYAVFVNGIRQDDPDARIEDSDWVSIASMLAGG